MTKKTNITERAIGLYFSFPHGYKAAIKELNKHKGEKIQVRIAVEDRVKDMTFEEFDNRMFGSREAELLSLLKEALDIAERWASPFGYTEVRKGGYVKTLERILEIRKKISNL